MFKLGKLTDYGTVVMTALAADAAQVHSAHDLAQSTGVSAPTVSKLLKLLAKSGLVEALRGAHGGYRLARPAERISIAQIVAAIEGPISLTECAEHSGSCSMESSCATSANWRLINAAIQQALSAVTLAHMTRPARRNASESPLTFFPAHRADDAV